MGRSMYNAGKRAKEIARQKKQMDKAAKRLLVKQNKANLKMGIPNTNPDTGESGLGEGEEVVEKSL